MKRTKRQARGLTSVDRQRIKEYLDETIIQMIPGTKLQPETRCEAQADGERYIFDDKGVKFRHPDGLLFQISKHRKFAKRAEKLVREIVNECFDGKIHKSHHWRETANGITNTAVARFASPKFSEPVQDIITLYASWASQTYEGARISHAIGVDAKIDSPISSLRLENTEEAWNPFSASACHLSVYRNTDEVKLLGSGANSLLLLDVHSYINGIEHVIPLSPEVLGDVMAPLAFCHLAHWANKDKRVAAALTRNGETLVFSNGKLQFAKRRGAWRYFPHDSLITDIIKLTGFKVKRQLLKSLHLTALDVSFTRGGACLGIIESNEQFSKLTGDDCLVENKPLYRRILNDRTFMELPRSLRTELCAIDGATILDKHGKVLCIGAILKNHGSNPEGGGGRTAAAKAISKFGIGIKVSNDGNIVAFPRNWSTGEEIQWA